MSEGGLHRFVKVEGARSESSDSEQEVVEEWPPWKNDPEDDVVVMLGHHQWVENDFNQREALRKRQRAYEKRYRAKKSESLRQIREEWVNVELDLYALLIENARAVVQQNVKNAHSLRARYHQLLLEERAIRLDTRFLNSAAFWVGIVERRNYSCKETLSTRQQWLTLERQILGTTATKPFQPLRFSFQW